MRQLYEDDYQVVERGWHENDEVSLGRMMGHPSLPLPKQTVELMRANLLH